MVNITFYGGIGEIGGNKILLEDGSTKIFLDFGLSFAAKSGFYDEFLQPRTNSCLRDQLLLGLIPPINGIYRQDLIELGGICDITKDHDCPDLWGCKLKSYDEHVKENGTPLVSAVLLTHAHADHYQYISFLDPRIAIICSPETKVILEAISDLSRTSVDNEICEANLREISRCGESSTFPGQPTIKTTENPVPREFTPLKSLEKTKIGGIEVTAVPVDHSVPGAYSYYIRTEDNKKIFYTGDLRFHGRLTERSIIFNEFIRANQIDILITEGTRIDKDKRDDETMVEERISKTVSSTGLTVVEFSWKDTTRFDTLQKAAETTGKTLVVCPKLAYLLYKLHKAFPNNFKPIEAYGNVKCYLSRTDSMLYSISDYSKDKYKAGYELDWGERSKDIKNAFKQKNEEYLTPRVIHFKNGVKAIDIRKDPEKYILMLSFFEIDELLDIKPPKGSVYIRARCEPFNDEMIIDDKKTKKWLNLFDINEDFEEDLPNFHVSGHASGTEIKEMVRTMNPNTIFPVHTLHPEGFNEFGSKVILPKTGFRYDL